MAARLADGVGLIRVSMFPGVLGMDVARDMSRAVAENMRAIGLSSICVGTWAVELAVCAA